ncbi:MAG: hypothetical protein LUH20_00620 [Lachnospiraceae bacterium]|nr:hypothetical protein [Lachnospiraceae bacterium]
MKQVFTFHLKSRIFFDNETGEEHMFLTRFFAEMGDVRRKNCCYNHGIERKSGRSVCWIAKKIPGGRKGKGECNEASCEECRLTEKTTV